MENEETTIINPPAVNPEVVAAVVEVAAQEAVQEAVEEVREQVTIEARVNTIDEKLTATHRYLDDVSGKLDRVLERLAVTEQAAIETEQAVRNVQTEIVEQALNNELIEETENIEAGIALQETIDAIENDDTIVEEVLDTNDVIDAILPEAKKEKRRLRFV